jgi:hypothetical protein
MVHAMSWHVISRKQENTMTRKTEKREAQASKINITLKLDKVLVRKVRVS